MDYKKPSAIQIFNELAELVDLNVEVMWLGNENDTVRIVPFGKNLMVSHNNETIICSRRVFKMAIAH